MLSPEAIAPLRLRPIRRGEYDRLVLSGAFAGEHIQLVEGALIEMSPQGPEHADTIERLTTFFVTRLGGVAAVRVQLPFAADDASEPEPDLALVALQRPRGDHPSAALLIIEVAGESLEFDLGAKARVYARAGVPDYWVIDLRRRAVTVHRRPKARTARYAAVRTLREGRKVSPLQFPELEIPVSVLVGSKSQA